MNKKQKVFAILCALELLFFIFLPNIYANSDDSCVLTIIPDKTQVNLEETVTISLTVSDITSKNGIAIYNGLVDYNSDIFELSVQDSSDGQWKGDLIENSVTFTKADLEATKEKQEIGRIVLKVKNNAPKGKQTITLKDNEFAEENTFKIADVNTSVEVIGNNNENNNIGDNVYDDSKNNTNGGSIFIVDQENKQTTTNNANMNNSNAQSTQFPYAGINGRFLIGILIVIIIIGIYSFYKYRKMRY